MPTLIVASLSFAALHLIVAGTGLRGVLVARLGAGLYRGLFSLATLGTLVLVSRSYAHAFASDNHFYWALPYAQHRCMLKKRCNAASGIFIG